MAEEKRKFNLRSYTPADNARERAWQLAAIAQNRANGNGKVSDLQLELDLEQEEAQNLGLSVEEIRQIIREMVDFYKNYPKVRKPYSQFVKEYLKDKEQRDNS